MSQTRQNKYPYYLNLRYENTSFKYKLGYKYQNVGTLLGYTHIHIYSAPTIKKHIKSPSSSVLRLVLPFLRWHQKNCAFYDKQVAIYFNLDIYTILWFNLTSAFDFVVQCIAKIIFNKGFGDHFNTSHHFHLYIRSSTLVRELQSKFTNGYTVWQIRG